MEHRLVLMVYIAGCLAGVFGYPSGQISASCDTMLPSHGNNVAQTSTAPYVITASNNTFNPGDTITVTIKASGSSTFKGFLLEARAVGGNAIAGTFSTSDVNAQILSCSAGASTAVSHTNGNSKTSITAKWTAPEGAGPVQFTPRQIVLTQFCFRIWLQQSTPRSIMPILPPAQTERSIAVIECNVESSGQRQRQGIGLSEQVRTYDATWLIHLTMSNTTCGSQKFCMSSPSSCSPSDNTCLFMSSSPSSSGTGYVFEMSGSVSGYVAIGFSDDTKMGSDDVYICTKNSSGNVLIQHGYNVGTTGPTISSLNTAGSVVTSYNNGVLKCSFITKIAVSTQQRSSTSSSYYVFLASGPSQADGTINQHTATLISSTKVDLSSYLSTSTLIGSSSVVLGHGALMLIAWMTTGGIGMIMARYMKSAAAKPVFGKAIWFQAHFFLMILTVILTIIAFIMVFAEVAGWSGDAGAHPVLGCIVMILSFFQPILAFFRPEPKSERRFIFNWGHAINALVIKILAVATIFLGLILLDKSTSQWMPKVMGGFFAWEVLFYIILETNMRLKTKGER
ncbi:putative ferric-chelate reductase 1 [Hyperolius riggenbachi]|uniref:putative ferric-chelate reductase 1 n=1 Tax=Hyperolius riggenbachi TaxID=752182 RepID=UPI0035A377A8